MPENCIQSNHGLNSTLGVDYRMETVVSEAPPTGLREMVKDYLAEVMSNIGNSAVPKYPVTTDCGTLSETIFSILTSRQFCYLSRARTKPYKQRALALLDEGMRSAEPLRFYYDVGAGYHASIHPGESELSFDVGLAELFVLFQIVSFCNRVTAVYPPGARFYLVIDNVCALMTNDIPIEKTMGYCASLRALIKETGLEDQVELMVESEEFSVSEHLRRRAEIAKETVMTNPSIQEVENVQRFLGRWCSRAEASERIARYKQAGPTTDSLFDRIIKGVHMTQRATGSTLGFRPFPGGDSRIQCGEVAISTNAKGKLHPILLTSRKVGGLTCTRLHYPDLLPSMITHVTYAELIRH